jgi:hypothetical protein
MLCFVCVVSSGKNLELMPLIMPVWRVDAEGPLESFCCLGFCRFFALNPAAIGEVSVLGGFLAVLVLVHRRGRRRQQ